VCVCVLSQMGRDLNHAGALTLPKKTGMRQNTQDQRIAWGISKIMGVLIGTPVLDDKRARKGGRGRRKNNSEG
jgi:hypothetical protein